MKKLLAMFAVVSAVALWAPNQGQAQTAGGGGGGAGGGAGGGGGGGGRGNFDPAQMRQRMMDRYKESMDIQSDDEWKVIEPRIQKVLDARQAVMAGGMRGMFGGGPRRGGGGDTGGDQAQPRRNFGPAPSVAATDLQKAIDSGASADTIKSKLAAFRDDKKEKQEKLDQAQADLKKVLKLKQEAAAVLAGLLD